MILSRNMLKRVGESRHPCRTPTVVRNQFPMLLLKSTALTSGLAIEVFDDLNKVGADVVLLHGCPQSCLPNPVEGLLEVYEDMVEVLLALMYFFMMAHKAACQTLSKAFLKSIKTWQRSCWCWRYFSHRMRRLKYLQVICHTLKFSCHFFTKGSNVCFFA